MRLGGLGGPLSVLEGMLSNNNKLNHINLKIGCFKSTFSPQSNKGQSGWNFSTFKK